VRYLLSGGSGAVISVQGGEFQAVPFPQLIDPETGRGRLRFVNIDTESYQVARDYMVRIGEKDFTDPSWVAKLAEAGNLSPEEFPARFRKLSRME
jgi:6-phosphofructokinase 1